MIPWFNYKISLPVRPLPPIQDRPEIRTKQLVVRPLLPADLEAFHALRSIRETQIHSTSRGRPDRDLDETRQNLAFLQAPYDERHWYWGAFLQSTGELIGEGGLPNIDEQPTSGWTRTEILIKPEHWRKGYGTELLDAILDVYWDLPREWRRHQLLPGIVPEGKEPGDKVIDHLEFVWESSNTMAGNFLCKALGKAPVSHEGFYEAFDFREGREGDLVKWGGQLLVNPRAVKKEGFFENL